MSKGKNPEIPLILKKTRVFKEDEEKQLDLFKDGILTKKAKAQKEEIQKVIKLIYLNKIFGKNSEIRKIKIIKLKTALAGIIRFPEIDINYEKRFAELEELIKITEAQRSDPEAQKILEELQESKKELQQKHLTLFAAMPRFTKILQSKFYKSKFSEKTKSTFREYLREWLRKELGKNIEKEIESLSFNGFKKQFSPEQKQIISEFLKLYSNPNRFNRSKRIELFWRKNKKHQSVLKSFKNKFDNTLSKYGNIMLIYEALIKGKFETETIIEKEEKVTTINKAFGYYLSDLYKKLIENTNYTTHLANFRKEVNNKEINKSRLASAEVRALIATFFKMKPTTSIPNEVIDLLEFITA
jgi:hypothetical protein